MKIELKKRNNIMRAILLIKTNENKKYPRS